MSGQHSLNCICVVYQMFLFARASAGVKHVPKIRSKQFQFSFYLGMNFFGTRSSQPTFTPINLHNFFPHNSLSNHDVKYLLWQASSLCKTSKMFQRINLNSYQLDRMSLHV